MKYSSFYKLEYSYEMKKNIFICIKAAIRVIICDGIIVSSNEIF